jgi:hypothetical protein
LETDEEHDHEKAASGASSSTASADARCSWSRDAEAREQTRIPERRKAEEENDEEEEIALSSKLVAAVRNAELHAAAARAAQGQHQVAPCPVNAARRPSAVKFDRNSEVSFFDDQPDASSELIEYRRALDTKIFDGPSGHKAKRICASRSGFSDDEASTVLWSLGATDVAEHIEGEDASAEEQEDWEDRCDDIAELMGQPRSCLLWSSSW